MNVNYFVLCFYFSVCLPRFQILLDLHQAYVKMMKHQVKLELCILIWKNKNFKRVQNLLFIMPYQGKLCWVKFFLWKKLSVTKIVIFPWRHIYALFIKAYKIRRYLFAVYFFFLARTNMILSSCKGLLKIIVFSAIFLLTWYWSIRKKF